MSAVGFGLDDKVSRTGDSMSGPLHFEGTPPFTVVRGLHAGTATLNGTVAVTVSTAAIDAGSMVLVTVQPAVAPAGIPYVASITGGSGFTLKSTSGSDTAVTVAWCIIETA